MSSTVNKIVEIFTFPIISPIVGKPNYETIAKVYLKLNENSASVHSNRGDGQLGLQFLTVSPAVYSTLYATAFIPPFNPGATAIITVGSNSAVINSKRQPFNDATVLFKQYDSADKDLKQILLGAVDEMFVRSLQTKYVGYLNVSTRDILEHLYSKYARISAADLEK